MRSRAIWPAGDNRIHGSEKMNPLYPCPVMGYYRLEKPHQLSPIEN